MNIADALNLSASDENAVNTADLYIHGEILRHLDDVSNHAGYQGLHHALHDAVRAAVVRYSSEAASRSHPELLGVVRVEMAYLEPDLGGDMCDFVARKPEISAVIRNHLLFGDHEDAYIRDLAEAAA